jgi:hypothetical protein
MLNRVSINLEILSLDTLYKISSFGILILLLCDHSPMTFNYFYDVFLNAGLCLLRITILFLFSLEINDSVA